MSESTKNLISILTSIIIFFVCAMYTYSPNNLPFRKHHFTVTSENGEVSSWNDLINFACVYKDSNEETSAQLRDYRIEIYGSITIDHIEKENGYVKIYSKYPYNEFGVVPALQRAFAHKEDYPNSGEYKSRYIILYLNKDYSLLPANTNKITFKADFNKFTNTNIIMANGEIIDA